MKMTSEISTLSGKNFKFLSYIVLEKILEEERRVASSHLTAVQRNNFLPPFPPATCLTSSTHSTVTYASLSCYWNFLPKVSALWFQTWKLRKLYQFFIYMDSYGEKSIFKKLLKINGRL